MNEESLFYRALETPLDQRAAFLDGACGADAALRQRVEVLLAAHENPDSFLAVPAVGAQIPLPDATSDSPRSSDDGPISHPVSPGSTVAGRYRLLELIGEGGMGTVWMAEQRVPVKRLVALKLIKPGMASKAVLARFEAERQALALMDHPSIAKVFDGGTTEDGCPYFVMELVRGIPLTQYCDERRLLIVERLDLFVQICQAVQHAHQKGIIHRDIKPTNILVTEHDGRPVPKVIDFGLAKALQGPHTLTEHTMFTAFGAMVGTPLYMAPEQVGINAVDVDTRSDVYALGVILYELLTGSTPLERQRFKEAAWDEICRLIREEEPPRPSLRLSSSDSAPSIAARRHTEPEKLGRLLRGDLDWIVLKSLEKDRTRRYETANSLAVDIQRHLSNEPVSACPPSSLYRFRKMVRRNKVAFAAATAVLAALVLGLGLSTWMFVQEREARQRAVAAEQEQAKLREEAEIARADEIERRKQAEAEAVATSLSNLAETYLLKRNRPQSEALYREALAVRRRSLGNEHPLVALSLNNLADVLRADHRAAEAETLYREALAIRRKLFGNDHPDVLASLNGLVEVLLDEHKLGEAQQIFIELLADHGDASPPSAALLLARANFFGRSGRWKEAAADLRQVVDANQGVDLESHWKWFRLTPLLVEAGDRVEYARHVQTMQTRFGGTTDPYIALRTAQACLLLPASGADMAAVSRLTDRSMSLIQTDPWSAFVKGWFEYRQGHYTSAVEWTQKALSEANDIYLIAQANLVLAMANQKLNQTVQARATLAKANDIIKRRHRKLDSGDLGDYWNDWLSTQILLREAKQLIEGNTDTVESAAPP